MRVVVIQSLQDLKTFKRSWDNLEKISNNVTPFQTWGWNYYWWKHLAGTKKLHTLLFFDDSKVVGIIPLWVRFYNGHSILEFIGSRGSDYLDILCIEKYRGEIIDLFLKHFISSDIDFINLEDIRDSSKTINAFQYRSRKHKLVIRKNLHSPCYGIWLPTTYNEFLKNLPRKLQRYIKKSSQMTHKIGKYTDIGKAISLHQTRQKEKGNSGTYADKCGKKFIKEVTKYFDLRNMLYLSMLQAQDRTIACVLSFTLSKTLYEYSSGMNPDYKYLRPGTILRGVDIENCIQNGFNYCDMMRDYEEYKIDWGGQEKMNVKIIIARNSVLSKEFAVIEKDYLSYLPYSPSSQ
jgi:hypothetical protein